MESSDVHIWSRQWGAYWRPNSSGYTEHKAAAGTWPFWMAVKMTEHCGPEKGIEFESLENAPVLARKPAPSDSDS